MVGFGRVAAGSVAGALALALIAACGTLSDPPLQHSFLVQLDPTAAAVSPDRKPAPPVYVAPVLVAAPFSGRSLVVRQSEEGFEADPQAEFRAHPVSLGNGGVRGCRL